MLNMPGQVVGGRRPDRPREASLRTVEKDLQPYNLGLESVC